MVNTKQKPAVDPQKTKEGKTEHTIIKNNQFIRQTKTEKNMAVKSLDINIYF